MCQPQFDPRRFPLFHALAEPQCLTLGRVARLSSVPRRGRIYSVGDPSDRVCFLETGIVKEAVPPQDDGPEILLAFLYPGDVFDESALVDDSARDHLTQACEAAKVWSLNRSVLLDLFSQVPALGYALLRLTVRRTRRCRMRVAGLLQKDAHSRVAHTLLNLAADRSVVDADGLLISLRLTQADLANMAGLARETVNIVLAHLRARGLVEMTRNHIRVREPVGLLGSVQAMRSPIRSEPRHDHDIHVRLLGGRAPSGADTRSVDRDARTRLRAAAAAQL